MKKSFMSVTLLVLSISMIAMLLCSSVAKAETGTKFVYNKTENTETVFTLDRSGRYLTPVLKYEFQTDEASGASVKKAYRRNDSDETWTPYYITTTTTTADGTTVMEYAAWDSKTGTYSLNLQKAVYTTDPQGEPVACHTYCRNSCLDEWSLSNQILFKSYLAVK